MLELYLECVFVKLLVDDGQQHNSDEWLGEADVEMFATGLVRDILPEVGRF